MPTKKRIAPGSKAELKIDNKKSRRQQQLDTSSPVAEGTADHTELQTPDAPPEENALAGAMAKVLRRELHAKNPVLAKRHTASSKAQKLQQDSQKQQREIVRAKKQLRRQNLIKPDVLQVGHEKQLRKIATRGVVALFNAISKHQKASNLQEEEQDSLKIDQRKTVKQEKGFLELLRSTTTNTIDSANAANKRANGASQSSQRISSQFDSDDEPSATGSNGKKWSVLKDDFMVGSRLEDWAAGGSTERNRTTDSKFIDVNENEDGWDAAAMGLDEEAKRGTRRERRQGRKA